MAQSGSYELWNVGLEDISDLRQLQMEETAGPAQSYTEQGIIDHAAQSVLIRSGECRAGYACVGTQDVYADHILEYYLFRTHRRSAAEILDKLSVKYHCKGWFINTRDPFALPLLVDMNLPWEINGYAFSVADYCEPETERLTETSFAKTQLHETKQAFDLAIQDDYYKGDMQGGRQEIEAGQIYSLRTGEHLIGTGFIAMLERTPRWAEIGMIVDPAYRCQGWGTHIIKCLVQECGRLGFVPIACCNARNSNSRKTLEKAGFYLDGCSLIARLA